MANQSFLQKLDLDNKRIGRLFPFTFLSLFQFCFLLSQILLFGIVSAFAHSQEQGRKFSSGKGRKEGYLRITMIIPLKMLLRTGVLVRVFEDYMYLPSYGQNKPDSFVSLSQYE